MGMSWDWINKKLGLTGEIFWNFMTHPVGDSIPRSHHIFQLLDPRYPILEVPSVVATGHPVALPLQGHLMRGVPCGSSRTFDRARISHCLWLFSIQIFFLRCHQAWLENPHSIEVLMGKLSRNGRFLWENYLEMGDFPLPRGKLLEGLSAEMLAIWQLGRDWGVKLGQVMCCLNEHCEYVFTHGGGDRM